MWEKIEAWLIFATAVAATIFAYAQVGKADEHQHSAEHMRGHSQYHAEFYSKWQTDNGMSCCNEADCAPIADNQVRFKEGELQVHIEGAWVDVPQRKIRPYSAPDMQSHLCHIGSMVFCFVYGAGA